MDRFVLHRVRGALLDALSKPNVELPELPTSEDTHLISCIHHSIQSKQPMGGLKAKEAWEADLGHPVADEMWKYCCTQTRFISPNYRHKLIHYKYIHRVYLAPLHLSHIHDGMSSNCPKCQSPGADFAHMTWNCTKLQPYWKEIARLLSLMIEHQLQLTPLLALMGYVKPLGGNVRRFTAMALLIAKRQISLTWGKPNPPTVQGWLRDLQYCNTASDDYASLLPISSRPRDIWQPLKDYIQQFPPDETND